MLHYSKYILVFGIFLLLYPTEDYLEIYHPLRHPMRPESLRQERKLSIIKHYSKQPIGQTFSDGSHATFSLPAIARAYFNLDAEVVNRIILNPSFKPYAKVGSNFTAIPYLCERKGDYDFALTI